MMVMIDIDKSAKRDANKVRELSEFAKKFLMELSGDLTQFEVEEVMFNDKHWILTVSYLRKINEPNELQRTLGILQRKVSKQITIDWPKKQVLGMSDRPLERREAA